MKLPGLLSTGATPVLRLRLGPPFPWRELAGLVGLMEAAPRATMEEPSMHRGGLLQREASAAAGLQQDVCLSVLLVAGREAKRNAGPGSRGGEAAEAGEVRRAEARRGKANQDETRLSGRRLAG